MNLKRILSVACAALGLSFLGAAHATLTVTPLTWNVVGLDSNSPATGPKYFPVGARVCSDGATNNVAVNFVWDSANANVNLRPGSPNLITILSIGAAGCSDAYFEAEVTQVNAAYDTTRSYHITATDISGTASSPTPRELYVEHLISQSRNSITGVKYGTNPVSLTPVPVGGSMGLVVGNTYYIELDGGTATQGYNQFEAFINFPNTIFQILSVNTNYSSDNSPSVPNPNDKLYADACTWQNDPNAPTYRSCVGGDFKAGGSNVVTTYQVRIIGGGGTSQTLDTLLYDFSGSSYHYNSDFSSGARIASIIDPTAAAISKSFSPAAVPVNGSSALLITLTNPNGDAVGGYNFVDNLPANMVIANPNGASTSGCGTPTLTATAGSSSISFSNGTLAGNGSCVIKVNVTPSATGTLTNTTNNLFVGTGDTGHHATADLTVNNTPPPPPGLCNVPLATWRFPTGFNTAAPVASTVNVASAASAAGAGVVVLSAANSTTTADGTQAWGSSGSITIGTPLVTANDEYFEFAIDTTGVTSVTLSFDALRKTPNGPQGLAVFYGTTTKAAGAAEADAPIFANNTAIAAQNTWDTFGAFTVNSGLNPSGLTHFRIYAYNSGNTNSGSDSNIDNVVFTGCAAPIQPTLAKAFVPSAIAVNAVSTLTFTLTNTNTAALTGAAFSDSLPSGVQVGATPSVATTCGGTWAPAAGNTTLTFSSGTIPASGSCTVSVNVTATTSGPHTNISDFISTTEGGTNSGTGGSASASLTAVLPPSIAKTFVTDPILAGGTSVLQFTITNPNQNDAIGGVAFTDTFPIVPGAMVVAASPNASTSGCGSPTFTPVGGTGSISFSGGTIAAGGTCIVTVNVSALTVGTYNNTSGVVSQIINAQTVNGNAASASLIVDPPHPSIGLLKQVSLSSWGPWSTFLPVSVGPVYYQFTVENTGDVPLSPISLTDDTLGVSACNAGFASVTLPVAVANNNNHIVTCVVGPVAISIGTHQNTAHATGTFSGRPVDSPNSSATYATIGLTLVKSVTESTFTLAGDVLHYSYLVTNSGFATLSGPVSVTDNKTSVSCPALNTIGDLDNFFDPGESITCTATYTVTGTDVTNAKVTNTASATVQSVPSNSDSRTVPLSTSADVSLVKTLTTAGPYTVGQSISYTLVVANAGPSTATSIQVTDTPTNLTITNVSGAGCAALPCTIASLASGANVTINVTATIDATGAFDNSATANAAQPDPDTSNNTDNTGNGGTALAPPPDLTITKSHSGNFSQGQVGATYTVTVTNSGSGDKTAGNTVSVTDTAPSGLTITAMSGTGWTCTTLPTCTRTDVLTATSSYPAITVTVSVAANATTPLVNSVAVSLAGQSESNSGNNTTTDSTIITVTSLPAASNDSATTPLNTPVKIIAYANDSASAGTTLNLATIDLDLATAGRQTSITIAGEGTFGAAANDGTVTFTPVTGFTGVVTVPYVIKDSIGQTSNTANITVTVLNTAASSVPAANNDSATTPLNTPVTIDAMANDAPGTGHTLTLSSIDLDPGTSGRQSSITVPGKGTFDASANDGTVTFTPVNGFAGTVITNYTVQDSGLGTSNVATITVVVTGGTLPVAQDDSGSTAPATPVTLSVLNNDSPGSGNTLTPATVDLDTSTPAIDSGPIVVPNVGTWTANADGSVTFTPVVGFTGTATRTYTVQDSGGGTSNVATITVIVNPTAAPVASNDSAVTPFNTPVDLNPAANDTAAVGAVLDSSTVDLNPGTAGIQRGPVLVAGQGTWQVIDNIGTVRFTPVSGYFGTTSAFTYAISDSLGHTATATMTVTVASSDMGVSLSGFPAASSPGATVTGTITCTNVGSGGAANASCGATGLPAGATVTCIPTSPQATLAVSASMVCSVSFTAPNTGTVNFTGTTNADNDGNPANNSASGSVKVVDAVDDGSVTIGSGGGTIPLLTNDTVGGATPAIGTDISAPTIQNNGGLVGLTVNGSGALVVPAGATPGVYTVTYRICALNPITACDTATVQITITAAPLPDLTITKTHGGNFSQGQTGATYTVTVTNSGNSDKTAGNTVSVTDAAPTGLTVTAMSGFGWTCTTLPTCIRTDVLTPTSSYPPITVTVSVAANATTPLVNSVAVSLAGQSESNSGNNTTTDSTIITASNSNGLISGSIWYDDNHNHRRDSNEVGRSGWTLELLSGITVVATTTTDTTGQYIFTGLAAGTYSIRFINPNGATLVSGPTPVNGEAGSPIAGGGTPAYCLLAGIVLTTDGSGNVSSIAQQSLPLDPSGVVYDSATRLPLAGAVVTLLDNGSPISSAFVAGGNATQTTGVDGSYEFFLLPGAPAHTYSLTVSRAGYTFPSVVIPATIPPGGFTGGAVTAISGAPQSGQNTTYYLQFPLPTQDITNDNIPLDPPASPAVMPIPTLSESMVFVLAGLLLLFGIAAIRKQEK